MVTVEDIISNDVVDKAYKWLCKRRKHYPPSSDIWEFRRMWPQEKTRLCNELVEGQYQVSLLSRVSLKNHGEEVDLWTSRDALVFKALSLVLSERLPISKHCAHIKGHGGGKGAVRKVLKHITCNRFVIKTDVRSYYASIEHDLLLGRMAVYIKDIRVLNLIGQYLRRCAERGGIFWEYTRGISLGSSLSPIMGAFFLLELDQRLERLGLFFVRFMDDILVLSPSRWKLRRAVKVVNQVLASLGLEKHPDKTFIGRIDRGFDFLGYHFLPGRITVARKTVENFVSRAILLYEQEPREAFTSLRLGLYVTRWLRWVGV
jgi:RNA-directed DNA polymerase